MKADHTSESTSTTNALVRATWFMATHSRADGKWLRFSRKSQANRQLSKGTRDTGAWQRQYSCTGAFFAARCGFPSATMEASCHKRSWPQGLAIHRDPVLSACGNEILHPSCTWKRRSKLVGNTQEQERWGVLLSALRYKNTIRN